jgi:hypothetical protein
VKVKPTPLLAFKNPQFCETLAAQEFSGFFQVTIIFIHF